MTNDDIQLVQRSWLQARPMNQAIAEVFFARLFELDPGMRTLFDQDLSKPRTRLLQIISASVRGLDRLDSMLPVLRLLGMRHRILGVRDEHYASIAAAWLWTLEKALRADFTPVVKSAWIKTYGVLSQPLREVAEPSLAA
jgi:hemoglobin-like flavoprotein